MPTMIDNQVQLLYREGPCLVVNKPASLRDINEKAYTSWFPQCTPPSLVTRSRSALHERFTELVGQPPIQYLTNWRVQLGATLLREGDAKVATIAQEVGYESEAAFARAFKRLVGTPPATWRRERGRDTPPPTRQAPPP